MKFLLSILFLLALVVWIIERKNIKAAIRGKIGEGKVNALLARLSDDYTTLNNIVLRTDKGTTQIDHIVLSKYAIFAIETKNYRGQIYGSDYMDQWKQIIRTDVRFSRKSGRSKTYTHITKNTFYNPVRQAHGHVIALQKFLEDYPKLPIIPIVVFIGRVNIETIVTKGCVIYDGELLDKITSYQRVCLSQWQVDEICKALQDGNVRDIVTKRDHVRNIRRSIREKGNAATSKHCPRCGGIMYKRFGTYGAFYGCGNFPRCRYTEPIKAQDEGL